MTWTKGFAQKYIYIFSMGAAITGITLLYICNFVLFKPENMQTYDLNRIFAYMG